jgi:hypothetical protein
LTNNEEENARRRIQNEAFDDYAPAAALVEIVKIDWFAANTNIRKLDPNSDQIRILGNRAPVIIKDAGRLIRANVIVQLVSGR